MRKLKQRHPKNPFFLPTPGFLLFAVLTVTLLSSAPAHLHLHSSHLKSLETALASAGRRAAAAEARALARAAAGAAAAEASLEKAATAAWHAAAAAGAQLSSWEHDAASRARHAAAALLGGRWPTPRWPALVFMGGALTCLGTSAVCHLFGCCAEHVATALWRADYGESEREKGVVVCVWVAGVCVGCRCVCGLPVCVCVGCRCVCVCVFSHLTPPFPPTPTPPLSGGIITLIVTSFVPPLVYGFECAPFWRDFYMWTTLSLGAAVFVIAMVPFFQAPRFRVARAITFTALALWGVAPAGHGLLLHGHEPAMVTAFWHYAAMGGLYLAGVTCFAARVPERWAPGVFDVWCHSHQLFHVFIVAAAAVHYRGVRVLLDWRDSAGGLCAA